MWLRRLWWAGIKFVFGLMGAGFGCCAGAIVLNQGIAWLKTAVWHSFTIESLLIYIGMGLPKVQKMVGLQKIYDMVLELPGVLPLVAAGFGCLFVFVWADGALINIEAEESKAEREKEREKRDVERKRASTGKPTNFETASVGYEKQLEEKINELLGKTGKSP